MLRIQSVPIKFLLEIYLFHFTFTTLIEKNFKPAISVGKTSNKYAPKNIFLNVYSNQGNIVLRYEI